MLVRVLGPFGCHVGGEPVDLGGPRQRAVLARLLTARGEVVSVDRLIEDLWRGEPPPRAIASLQAYVSNLRRLLEPDREPRTPARLLVSAPPGYAIRLPGDAVDAWRFEALLGEARTAPDAVPQAELLAHQEPLREERWRLLALALWASGRQADALAALRRARRV